MSVRGPTGKFFFDKEHDVYLYMLVLEHHVYDDEKEDFVYTSSGEIKISCGWQGIAEKMTAVFGPIRKGQEFTAQSVRSRYDKVFNGSPLKSPDLDYALNKYSEELFNCAMDLRDQIDRVTEVMEA